MESLLKKCEEVCLILMLENWKIKKLKKTFTKYQISSKFFTAV